MINKIKKIIKNYKFKKNNRLNKSKLYIKSYNNNKHFKSTRNKFKLFKNKIQFENTYKTVKKLNLYYYLIGLFLIFSVIYILFFSHYFYIKSINIIREDEFVNYNIAYKAVDKYRQKSIFLINPSELKKSILDYQPHINNVQIKKIYPNNLRISLKSNDIIANFLLNEKKYSITNNGVFLPVDNFNEEYKNLEIKGLNESMIYDYKQALSQKELLNLDIIIELLKTTNSFITNIKNIYYLNEKELHIIDTNGTVFIFSLLLSPEVQIQKLNVFYNKNTSITSKGLIYVDLRVNQKIFYCDRSTEFQCRNNLKTIYD